MRKNHNGVDDVTKDWQLYEAGKAFNNRLEPTYYDTVTANWEFYNGNQWINSGAFDDLPKPVFNVTNRIISFFVASLTSSAVKIAYDKMAKLPFSEDSEVDIEILNASMANFSERVKLQDLVRQMYLDGANSGDMCIHLFFNPDVKPYDGKLSKVMGQVEVEIIDGTNLYLGNPNSRDIQTQPHVIIAGRATIKELQNEYDAIKDNDDFTIQHDGDFFEQVGQGGKIELEEVDELGKATYILIYKKKKVKTKSIDEATGEETEIEETRIVASKSIRDRYIYKDVDTGLNLYPVAFSNWEIQKNQYHGRALCTSIIPNQIFINRMFAMAMQNLMMTAFPKAVIDADKIASWSNKIGSVIKVHKMTPSDSLLNVARYLEPGQMSNQITNLIDMTMNYTKDMLGANSALLGSVNPELASGTAITIAARQSGVPLENPKNNMYSLLEDTGRIYLDMVTTYYGERPILFELDGKPNIVLYDFNKLKDIYLSTKVDVGATTYWNEIAMIQTLDNLLASQRIEFIDYLERVPDDYITDKSGLLAKEKNKIAMMEQQSQMQAQPQSQPMEQGDEVSRMIEQLPADVRSQFEQLPPDQQQTMMSEFMGQQ